MSTDKKIVKAEDMAECTIDRSTGSSTTSNYVIGDARYDI